MWGRGWGVGSGGEASKGSVNVKKFKTTEGEKEDSSFGVFLSDTL